MRDDGRVALLSVRVRASVRASVRAQRVGRSQHSRRAHGRALTHVHWRAWNVLDECNSVSGHSEYSSAAGPHGSTRISFSKSMTGPLELNVSVALRAAEGAPVVLPVKPHAAWDTRAPFGHAC